MLLFQSNCVCQILLYVILSYVIVIRAATFMVRYAWYGAITYDWDQFLVASGSSLAAIFLWAGSAYLLKRFVGFQGIGVSDILSHIPGFRFFTGSGLDFDLMDYLGLSRFVQSRSVDHTAMSVKEFEPDSKPDPVALVEAEAPRTEA